MKQEDTRERILEQALELFSEKGYDSVSVGEIARAVGIKAPSLYNHFHSKRAIFDAIVESTAAQYEADTGKIDIHVQNVSQDIPVFTEITAEALFEKVRQIFEYSLHNAPISRFRRMMTIEQFRSPELAALYSRRYVDRLLAYHAGIFRALIAAGELQAEDPDALAMQYVAPVLTLIGICDRQPEREAECLDMLRRHVALFSVWFTKRSRCNERGRGTLGPVPGLRRKNAAAAAAADNLAGVPALLPEMPPGEHHQRKKFSNRRSQSARRKDAVLTMSDVVSTAFFEQEEQNETNAGTKAWPARPCQLFFVCGSGDICPAGLGCI